MTLNRSGTSYRLEWNSRSASAERMSHLIVICSQGGSDTHVAGEEEHDDHASGLAE